MATMTLTEVNAKLIADKLAHDPGVFMDVDQVATRYSVSTRQWEAWTRCGLTPEPVKVAGLLRWAVAELVRWEWTQSAGDEAWDLYENSIASVDVTTL